MLFERLKFVVTLRQLAESCEFESLRESLIHDRLAIDTRDSATRDRLLRERPVPSLVRCIEALFMPVNYPDSIKSSLRMWLTQLIQPMHQTSIG